MLIQDVNYYLRSFVEVRGSSYEVPACQTDFTNQKPLEPLEPFEPLKPLEPSPP